MDLADFDKPITNTTDFDFEPYNSKELTSVDASYKIDYLITNPGTNQQQHMLSNEFDKISQRSKKIKSLNTFLKDDLWLDPVLGIIYTKFYEKPLFVGTEKCFSNIEFHD